MRGFILVILIAVVIVVTINTGVCGKKGSTPDRQLEHAMTKTAGTDLETSIRTISHAIDLYYTDHGEYPGVLDLLIPQYIKTEQDLLDPWRNKYKIQRDEEMNVYLTSPGRDLIWESEDDIKRRI
jgi:hypothetical protein